MYQKPAGCKAGDIDPDQALLQQSELDLHCSARQFYPSTVELQWLEHLWDHENIFETGSSS